MTPGSRIAAEITDADVRSTRCVLYDTPEWVALCEWLTDHGIDPDSVLGGEPIVREGQARRIRYTGIVRGSDGMPLVDHAGCLRTTPMVQQRETIAPLPAIVAP